MFPFHLKTVIPLMAIIKLATVNCELYEFVFEHENITQKCAYVPGNNGLEDLFDLSNFTMEYNDGKVHIAGSARIIWNVKTTDRVQFIVEVYKYQRGTWQPTILTLRVQEFCSEQYRAGYVWHDCCSRFIVPPDQLCVNNFQHVYHLESENLDNTVMAPRSMAGRLKARVTFEAFDERNVKRPMSICFDIVGDLVKIRK